MLAYPRIDPVALSLGPLQVHWYGLMYLFAFLAGWGTRALARLAFGMEVSRLGTASSSTTWSPGS